MKGIEEELNDLKNNIDNIEVPDELEFRLKHALDGKHKRRRFPKLGIVAGIAIMIIAASNYTALADYIGQLFGFEKIFIREEFGALKEMAEEEKVQIINKSNHFKNGMELAIDGIMIDPNRVVIYYTLTDKKGEVDKALGLINPVIDHLKMSMSHTTWTLNEEKTQAKMMSIITAKESTKSIGDSVNVIFTLYGEKYGEDKIKGKESVEIAFNVNEDMIIEKSTNIYLNKAIELRDMTVYVEYIALSPTGTTVKGHVINHENIDLEENDHIEVLMSLEADERKVIFRSGSSASLKWNWNFTTEFDAIPKNAENVTFKVEGVEIHQYPNELFTFDKGDKDATYRLGDKEFIIKDIKTGNNKALITIDSNHTGMTLPKLIRDENVFRPVDLQYQDEYMTDDGQLRVLRTYVYDIIDDGEQKYQLEFYDIVKYKYPDYEFTIPLKE